MTSRNLRRFGGLLRRLTRELVHGEPSGKVRCSAVEMSLPEVPKETSFFAQQALADGV